MGNPIKSPVQRGPRTSARNLYASSVESAANRRIVIPFPKLDEETSGLPGCIRFLFFSIELLSAL
jgi:hypothetical protein